MLERLASIAPRAWLLVPVALAGILWAALDVSWTVLCAIGLVSLALILAIAALRKRNERAPFPS